MHTPGPWKQLRDEVWVGKRRICSHVSAGESLPLGEDYKRGMENARLIAAAPDLLEALKMADELAKALEEMKEQIEQSGQTHCLGSCYEAANRLLKTWWKTSGAAIAKAEGK